MPAELDNKRTLRQRLERKIYNDEDIDDDDIEGKRTFDVYEKLEIDDYDAEFVQIMKGEDVNVKYLQENGFTIPILIKDKTGSGIRVPSENFTVEEVKKCVGSRRIIDVLDVNTQKAMELTMKDWVKYYTADPAKRERLLNVLSLECSHTRLENYVEQPDIVKQIDWVDTVWPRHLKDKQTETTNILEKMFYPKVQRYCLMSVAGCYTDFHIDMGGTSVWYHILHGAKIFWLIPPTEKNLRLYEEWVLSGKQGDEFFADKVEKCQRLRLEPGWTFLIPTGWIHGVYTPEDSLVFGGNYIHSFNISLQLRIWDIENKTHVPMKFRYPFFTEMHWYVLERYVQTLTGKSYRQKTGEELKEEIESLKSEQQQPLSPLSPAAQLDSTEDEKSNDSTIYNAQSPLTVEHNFINNQTTTNKTTNKTVFVKFENGVSNGNHYSNMNSSSVNNGNRQFGVKVHLTRYELEGISDIIAFLQNLPAMKRYVPKDIMDPEGLIEDSKIMLIEHQTDDPEFAVTGEFTLRWAPRKKDKKPKVRTYSTHFSQKTKKQPRGSSGQAKEAGTKKLRRRVRCKQCEPCTREDCRICHFCKDMKKYGGAGVMKQCCLSRQCISPVLPKTAVCTICLSEKSLNPSQIILETELDPCIMECGFCYEIVHPYCFRKLKPDLQEGVENEDLPNSWECPKCITGGKGGAGWKKEYPKGPGQKRLVLAGRTQSTESDISTNDEMKSEPTSPIHQVTKNDKKLTLEQSDTDIVSVVMASSNSRTDDANDSDEMDDESINEKSDNLKSDDDEKSHGEKTCEQVEDDILMENGCTSDNDENQELNTSVYSRTKTTTLSPTVSPSSISPLQFYVKRNLSNGHIHIDGLRQVSVHIERLTDLSKISPNKVSPSTTPTKIKISPLKMTTSGSIGRESKADDCSDGNDRKRRFTRSSSAQSDSSQDDQVVPLPNTRTRHSSSGRSTPTNTRSTKSGSGQNTPNGGRNTPNGRSTPAGKTNYSSESEFSQDSGPSLRRSGRRTRDESIEAAASSESGAEEEPCVPVKKAKRENNNRTTSSPQTITPTKPKTTIVKVCSPKLTIVNITSKSPRVSLSSSTVTATNSTTAASRSPVSPVRKSGRQIVRPSRFIECDDV